MNYVPPERVEKSRGIPKMVISKLLFQIILGLT